MKQASSRKVQNLTVFFKLLKVFLCRTFLFEQKQAVSETLIIIKDIESKNKIHSIEKITLIKCNIQVQFDLLQVKLDLMSSIIIYVYELSHKLAKLINISKISTLIKHRAYCPEPLTKIKLCSQQPKIAQIQDFFNICLISLLSFLSFSADCS